MRETVSPTFPNDFSSTTAETLFDLCPDRVTLQIVVLEHHLHDVLSACSWESWTALEHHRRGYDEAVVTDMDAYEKWLRTAGSGTAIADAPSTAASPKQILEEGMCFDAAKFC